jgi:hypothetical protein
MLHSWIKPLGMRETKRLAKEIKVPENLYASERVSSGNFTIVKPKRSKRKLRQLRLKSPGGGMRKN